MKLKYACNKFVKSFTMHGLPRVFNNANIIIRIIWIIAILISLALCLITVAGTVSEYLEFNVVTELDLVMDKHPLFPAVTICGNETNMTDLLVECTFKRKECNIESDFVSFNIHFKDLNCLRYNGFGDDESIKTTDGIGFQNGLKLVLKSRGEEGVYFFDLTDGYLSTFVNELAFPLDKLKDYDLSVTKHDENKLGEPFNNCNPDLNKTYRHKNCLEKCYSKKMTDKYNCSKDGYFSDHKSVRCREKYSSDWILDKIKSFESDCLRECPTECRSVEYVTDVGVSQPDNQNTTTVYVYFKSLQNFRRTQIAKVPMPVLLSSLGGSLGLFLGLRFLSIVELIEFLIEIICILFTNKFLF